jgi:type III restriction enzyme
METLVFVWEFEKVRTRKELLQRYAQSLQDVRLPPYDDFARYSIKMATGSGKTKVMALAVAWQFFNAVREPDEVAKDYAKTFLVLASNVIVFERLKTDFAGSRIFRADPRRNFRPCKALAWETSVPYSGSKRSAGSKAPESRMKPR